MEIRKVIDEIVKEITRVDISGLPAHSPLEAIGVDSLSMAELCYQIEMRFRIEIANDVYALHTLQDFITLIAKKAPETAAAQ